MLWVRGWSWLEPAHAALGLNATPPPLPRDCRPGTEIKWKPGKDVTVKVMKKKAKPGECKRVGQNLHSSGHRRVCACARAELHAMCLAPAPSPAPPQPPPQPPHRTTPPTCLPGSKGGGKPQTKTEDVPSFFRWFTDVPEVCVRTHAAARALLRHPGGGGLLAPTPPLALAPLVLHTRLPTNTCQRHLPPPATHTPTTPTSCADPRRRGRAG